MTAPHPGSSLMSGEQESGGRWAPVEGLLPLSTYPEVRLGYSGLVFDGSGSSLFNLAHNFPHDQAGQAASYIVTACNAFPALYEAGEVAADMLDMFLRCWAESKEISDEEGKQATAALMRFNAALALARSENGQ